MFGLVWVPIISVLSTRSLQDGTSATPFLPTVVPLAVRSPYLGAYLSDGTDKDLTEMSPRFWTGSPLGWTGLIRVDGDVFNWMGNLTYWPAADNIRFAHSASSSNFTFAVGSSDQDRKGSKDSPRIYLHASFLSPITPADSFRQSLPLSYLSITVESADDKSHQVEVYTDINGLWCADEEEEVVEWDVYDRVDDQESQRAKWQALSMRLDNQRSFTEQNDRILQGAVWFSSLNNDSDRIGQTYSAGEHSNYTRSTFSLIGRLNNQKNQNPRPIRTRHPEKTDLFADEPVLSFAHSFGFVSPRRTLESRTILMSIGHVRSPLMQYMTEGERVVELMPLWTTRFETAENMVEFHLKDYQNACVASQEWDHRLVEDSKRAHSQDYADIVSISTRQIFMALEAVRIDDNSTAAQAGLQPIENGQALMLKEISSNGNCQTVDVITPMLPFLIYAAPDMIPQLLEPIFRYVSTGLYEPKPAPHDLGDHYPNATGRNDFIYSNLPLEESGNMLNLVLACVRLEKCKEQAQKYYALLTQWADWLVENTLYPEDQLFEASSNQTSLVIKGILGLRSMSEIAYSLGYMNESSRYRDIAAQYSRKFLQLAVADDRTHLLGSYGNQSSWSTEYNLFFDKLYGFNFFPEWIYNMQDNWYMIQAGGPYGPPLDSRSRDRAKTDWIMWAAGASNDAKTRDMFVNALSSYVRQTDNQVFGDLISLNGGWSVGFLNRPVVGGHFSLLALDVMIEHGPPNEHHLIILSRIFRRKRLRKELYQSMVAEGEEEGFGRSNIRGRSLSIIKSLQSKTRDSLRGEGGDRENDSEGLQIRLLQTDHEMGRNRFSLGGEDASEKGFSDEEEGTEADWDIGLQNRKTDGTEATKDDGAKKND
ncbi:hypothetical protein PPACK8108_LOCUS23360 [Phakopsora pachyrhizi]|uniref:Glutaminase GtaA n=1 Tax=Phakopsora pachyrhizi TaxID=170000 RepID=A0AAV0BPX1_PHAPC|nr:hypothetical protein PPACK8108_LOCUS23360 [Phakopsora pachyrhizi]